MHELFTFVGLWLLTHIVGRRTLNRLRLRPSSADGDEPPVHPQGGD